MQRLIFASKELDGGMLSKNYVKDGSMLYLLLGLSGGGKRARCDIIVTPMEGDAHDVVRLLTAVAASGASASGWS